LNWFRKQWSNTSLIEDTSSSMSMKSKTPCYRYRKHRVSTTTCSFSTFHQRMGNIYVSLHCGSPIGVLCIYFWECANVVIVRIKLVGFSWKLIHWPTHRTLFPNFSYVLHVSVPNVIFFNITLVNKKIELHKSYVIWIPLFFLIQIWSPFLIWASSFSIKLR